MTILCVNCAKADLEKASVRLSGEIRKHPYTVEMQGLKCPNCGYATVDSKSMAEFGRLVADEYRRAHGLLTSDEIVALRHRFGDNQEQFAKRVGVGIASIKRWELGKIQDRLYDDLIREKTTESVNSSSDYRYTYITAGTSNTACSGSAFEFGARLNSNTVLVSGLLITASINTGGWGTQGTRESEQTIIIAGTSKSQNCFVAYAPATTEIPIVHPVMPRGYCVRH
jgi:putative zinc finger/helix-turn-helix YgiT family protein